MTNRAPNSWDAAHTASRGLVMDQWEDLHGRTVSGCGDGVGVGALPGSKPELRVASDHPGNPAYRPGTEHQQRNPIAGTPPCSPR
jgi:hypothetical protein